MCPLLHRANPGRPGDAEPRGPRHEGGGQPSRRELSIWRLDHDEAFTVVPVPPRRGPERGDRRLRWRLFLHDGTRRARRGDSPRRRGHHRRHRAVGRRASPEIGASSVSGLRVSITGTALQTTTDGSGRFTLSGVPSGRVELRFEGSGIDARLELEGLQSGQTLNRDRAGVRVLGVPGGRQRELRSRFGPRWTRSAAAASWSAAGRSASTPRPASSAGTTRRSRSPRSGPVIPSRSRASRNPTAACSRRR